MPFKSEKQRRYLWANEPEIARDWTDTYGSRVKKDNGGIMDAWGKHATATEAMKLMNQPDYHQKAGYNFMQNFPNIPQWLANTLATGYQYGSEGFKALKGGTDFSDAMSRAGEEARLNKLGIKGLGFDEGEYENFMQNYNTANEIQPDFNKVNLMSMVPDNFIEQLKSLWGGEPPTPEGIMKAGGYPFIDPADGNYISREPMLAEYASSDDYENIDRFTETAEEGDDSDNWFMRALSFLPLVGDRSRSGILMRGLTNKYLPSGLNFRDSRFYRPATQGAYGYSPAQLNKMNALGGYYSEPARGRRRWEKRQTNILNRAAAGKPVGNVNKLLGQHGYQSDGSGGISFTGTPQGDPTAGAGYSRSDDSWSSSPFRKGGLASLWQR